MKPKSFIPLKSANRTVKATTHESSAIPRNSLCSTLEQHPESCLCCHQNHQQQQSFSCKHHLQQKQTKANMWHCLSSPFLCKCLAVVDTEEGKTRQSLSVIFISYEQQAAHLTKSADDGTFALFCLFVSTSTSSVLLVPTTSHLAIYISMAYMETHSLIQPPAAQPLNKKASQLLLLLLTLNFACWTTTYKRGILPSDLPLRLALHT